MDLDALLRLHAGLPRQGPGSDDATRDALRTLGPFPRGARVLDLGCGPGRASLAVALSLDAPRILAVDLLEPFVEELRAAAAARGLSGSIEARVADMLATGEPPASADLVVCEGAIYAVGFERGLRAIHALMKPGGAAAVTDLAFTGADLPPDFAAYWRAAYPAMTTVSENVRVASAAGFDVVAARPLPARAWWDEYYGPLEARCRALAAEPTLRDAIASTREEIDVRRRHAEAYDSVSFLLRRAR